jgi:predicted nucleic acid-binding protein
MILVDTSVIVAWIDPDHELHAKSEKALVDWAGQEDLAISALTYAELASAGRSKDAIEEMLSGFVRLDFDFNAAFRAGQAYGRWNPGKGRKPVLPDFLIRGQASVLGVRHLTNDRHQIQAFPEVDFLFP